VVIGCGDIGMGTARALGQQRNALLIVDVDGGHRAAMLAAGK
jgi:Trk K+ transport system NAD-binding subunit